MVSRLLRLSIIVAVVLPLLAPSLATAAHGHYRHHQVTPTPTYEFGHSTAQRWPYYGFPPRSYRHGAHLGSYFGQVHAHRGYYGDVWEWGRRLRY